jgi:hypothetical protein
MDISERDASHANHHRRYYSALKSYIWGEHT